MSKIKLKLEGTTELDELTEASRIICAMINQGGIPCLYDSEVRILRSIMGHFPTDFYSDKYATNEEQISDDLMAIAFAITMPADIR